MEPELCVASLPYEGDLAPIHSEEQDGVPERVSLGSVGRMESDLPGPDGCTSCTSGWRPSCWEIDVLEKFAVRAYADNGRDVTKATIKRTHDALDAHHLV
ncbi:MAG: hypothetical protein E6J90_36950 [Deltaproteobacteria bacterium]|nr:MAG: hypothetical protein E6J90_36950 [Deltaproteobacteria bacterium]